MEQVSNTINEPIDVLIIGAGMSGIGAAYHLQTKSPSRSFIIVEARADMGGTWDLFKYPGIRSDSDLYTFGYDFKPWKAEKAIADGPSIKAYIKETAQENNLEEKIWFNHKVIELNWDSQKKIWRITLQTNEDSQPKLISARWIFNASGYYRYDQGYSPSFKNQDAFLGPIIHPQHWPENLNYADKKIIVIGSGATAVTLVPALAKKAAHVTMLQRTPSYILPVPEQDPIARLLRPLLSEKAAFALTRKFNIAKQKWVYSFCQRFPKQARRLIRKFNSDVLPKNYPVDKHFCPPYEPWDQRLCAAPNGDFFKAISQGAASIVTDQIDSFSSKGINLSSGEQIEADIIITATGLNLAPLGGLIPKINNTPVQLNECITYKGMLLSQLPNFAIAVGYTSSSWTLKIGLLCEYFCRLLNFMEQHDYVVCEAIPDKSLNTMPLMNFGAGYILRSAEQLPKQGDKHPWAMSWSYASDVKIFKKGRIDDPALKFE
ncbi:flavin-containing monooxygenase [Pleionea litopenaei]|uniref:NAD(P)/FAD-dependent oxidoreductase n=1 Tax=Pleionea litopenaei TaxID=3070815 RepID=A0AA51RUH6_9GAMM|nr:NAD(P)/FAD-dependent oxidoreductase [Pleionea sp. HL-JVS1]WMS87856.1 NAD(P)/FAD-dependent oxidoreductase [Pleionea sp. HL-JVS1]